MRSLGDRVEWESPSGPRTSPSCLDEAPTPARTINPIQDPTAPLIGLDELRQLLQGHGIAPVLAERLLRLRLPAVGLVGLGGCTEGRIGQSHLGGRPDVPKRWTWPTQEGYPLGLVAQIDIADLQGMPGTNVLPPGGHLAFFYGFYDDTIRATPRSGAWTVQWYPPRTTLRRAPYPVWPADPGIPEVYSPTPIELFAMWSLPSSLAPAVAATGVDTARYDDAQFAYETAIARRLGVEWPVHQLLGHASGALQHDPAEDFARERPQSPAIGSLRSLLQIDSDGHSTDFLWGDAGRLFFMIPSGDLDRHDFTHVWLDFQN